LKLDPEADPKIIMFRGSRGLEEAFLGLGGHVWYCRC